jgi:DHA3 family macrolide efflux protein-like MFS transporter
MQDTESAHTPEIETAAPLQEQSHSKTGNRLWTPSFFILWQGQLVSTLGDAAYSVALGFWVLAVTGSTALMGTLMAASTLPGVLVSPFAGVLIDRANRKRLLILMDFIRGMSIVFIAVAAYQGFIAVWMVFVAGVTLSVCGAFFRPGVSSIIPDLVPKSKLVGANSVLSIVTNGASMLGNVMGGFLFSALGAPVLFLFDGLSYLFSGSSISFVKIPKVKIKSELNFFKDMIDGYHFIWRLKGLRYIMLTGALDNFISFIAIILLLPLFQKSPELGAGKYGVAMACFMGGAMAGYVFTSIAKVAPSKKLRFFMASNAISNLSLALCANLHNFTLMAVLLLIGGIFNSFVNVTVNSAVQIATPQEMRGKVISFMSMTTQGLTPFAMALGGVLAAFIPIRLIMTVCFSLVFVIITPFMFVKPYKKFLNFDYEKDTIDDLIDG